MTKLITIFITTLLLTSCDFFDSVTTHHPRTNDMAPTIMKDDVIEIDYHNKVPDRQDIIVFGYEWDGYDPNDFWSSDEQIGRVIGLPTDTVEIENGIVYVNGNELDESGYEKIEWDGSTDPIVMQDEEYYVLGDNRALAEYDSRVIGPVPYFKIVGTVTKK